MADSQLQIRTYTLEDQPQIEWLYARTPPAGQIAVRPQMVPVDLRRVSDFYAQFLVASQTHRAEEAIVGMVGIEHVGSHEIAPPVPPGLNISAPTARLRHVAVAPELWRRGIGGALVESAVTWCRDNEYPAVILETTPQQEAAVSLYASMGFTEIARSKIGSYDLIWFQLNLQG